MFIPFISPSSGSSNSKKLYRRKGGGGRGASSGVKGGKRGSSGKNKGSGSGKKHKVTFGSASSSARGGGVATAIPAGQLFAGRMAGGATRSQIYGTRAFGSGYPGVASRGVSGRGFPFYFWPLAWGGVAGGAAGAALYLHTDEYGLPDNSSRPGGVMMVSAFPSSSTGAIYRLLSDNVTVAELQINIKETCKPFLQDPSAPARFIPSAADAPKPEQAVQYYRASSIVVTLDGYNNTATFLPEGTPDTSFPGNFDIPLMNCMNETIGSSAPLIDGASMPRVSPSMALLGLDSVFVHLMTCHD